MFLYADMLIVNCPWFKANKIPASPVLHLAVSTGVNPGSSCHAVHCIPGMPVSLRINPSCLCSCIRRPGTAGRRHKMYLFLYISSCSTLLKTEKFFTSFFIFVFSIENLMVSYSMNEFMSVNTIVPDIIKISVYVLS